jgi:hypothetical protein
MAKCPMKEVYGQMAEIDGFDVGAIHEEKDEKLT